MTKQEAEALAVRLVRVWQVQPFPKEPTWHLWDIGFYFTWGVVEGVSLSFGGYDNGPIVELELDDEEVELLYKHGQITPCWTNSDGDEFIDPGALKRFAEKWLPFFRRGCWLSGCDIEASAHEKAEWMQGFTREEIEAWSLKL